MGRSKAHISFINLIMSDGKSLLSTLENRAITSFCGKKRPTLIMRLVRLSEVKNWINSISSGDLVERLLVKYLERTSKRSLAFSNCFFRSSKDVFLSYWTLHCCASRITLLLLGSPFFTVSLSVLYSVWSTSGRMDFRILDDIMSHLHAS